MNAPDVAAGGWVLVRRWVPMRGPRAQVGWTTTAAAGTIGPRPARAVHSRSITR